MADYRPVGTPTNETERIGIRHLRDQLPEHFVVVGNFELQLPRRKNTLEYDSVVFGEWGIYAVEIKGWGGTIRGDQSRWQLEWGDVENPFILIERKAKALRDFLAERIEDFPDGLCCEAVVYLPREDVEMEVDDDRNARLVETHTLWNFFVDRYVDRGPGLLRDGELRESLCDALIPRAEPGSTAPNVPNYVIEEEVDRGERPYREFVGRHQMLQSRDRVRIKVYSMDPLMSRAERKRKFARAVRDLEALDALEETTYVAQAYDIFRDDDDELVFYLVSEWLGARTLGDHIDRTVYGPRMEPEIRLRQLRLAEHLTRAVQFVHERGIVHRNLQPEAIYLCEDNRSVPLVLADFDYARVQNLQSIGGEVSAIGTEGYVAPEMWRDESHDRRADIYSLGVVLFELLTGRPLFRGISEILEFDGVWRDRRDILDIVEAREIIGDMLRGEPDERLEDLGRAIDVFESLRTERN